MEIHEFLLNLPVLSFDIATKAWTGQLGIKNLMSIH